MVFDDEGLPDLPVSRKRFGREFGVKEIQQEDDFEESQALPAFPDSPTHNKFSQVAIREAVGGEDSDDGLPDLPEIPGKAGTSSRKTNLIEMEEWQPALPVENERFLIPEGRAKSGDEFAPSFKERAFDMPRGKKGEDVFVKLTKFHSAKRALAEIRDKIEEIDELINRIRDTKMREEQEFKAWENEIMYIKARMQDVAENIFEKVD